MKPVSRNTTALHFGRLLSRLGRDVGSSRQRTACPGRSNGPVLLLAALALACGNDEPVSVSSMEQARDQGSGGQADDVTSENGLAGAAGIQQTQHAASQAGGGGAGSLAPPANGGASGSIVDLSPPGIPSGGSNSGGSGGSAPVAVEGGGAGGGAGSGEGGQSGEPSTSPPATGGSGGDSGESAMCQNDSDCTHKFYDRPVTAVDDCYCPQCPDPTDEGIAILRSTHDEYERQWRNTCLDWEQDNPCYLVPCSLPPPVECNGSGTCVLGVWSL